MGDSCASAAKTCWISSSNHVAVRLYRQNNAQPKSWGDKEMLAMGSIYPRGNVLWLAYQNAAGKRVCKSSGLLVGHEPDARATLAAIERQVAAELRAGEGAF